MLDNLITALRARSDLQAWTVRHILTRGAQLYAVPNAVESRRTVSSERYVVDVLRQPTESNGQLTCGSGNATLLPGDDIDTALNAATLMAKLVHNPPYSVPGPAGLPTVPLVDAALHADAANTLDTMFARLKTAVSDHAPTRMTAAEAFGEETTTHLINSRGIDATQVTTQLNMEWVLAGRSGEHEVESFVEITRRRATDLDVEAEVARRAHYVVDLLEAAAPPHYTGPVVLRGQVLAEFLNGGVLHTLSSGASKYSQLSSWEIGKTIFRGDVIGDPLTVWANRQLPYGTHANRFDDEGLPAQRVTLIENNRLATFIANQRYADYLSIPPTGAFGDLELPPGSTPAHALLAEPHVEVVAFSWFNPDGVTGEFASEIRLGYMVDGNKRTPFKGGMLVGNVLDALADVRWSSETGFYGDYSGPTTARFARLAVAGNEQA